MSKLNKESVIGISALLVHAANIDENYSEHEKDLVSPINIKQFWYFIQVKVTVIF